MVWCTQSRWRPSLGSTTVPLAISVYWRVKSCDLMITNWGIRWLRTLNYSHFSCLFFFFVMYRRGNALGPGCNGYTGNSYTGNISLCSLSRWLAARVTWPADTRRPWQFFPYKLFVYSKTCLSFIYYSMDFPVTLNCNARNGVSGICCVIWQ